MKKITYLLLSVIVFTSCNTQEIKSLKLENSNLENRIESLENQVYTYKNENETLRYKNDDLELNLFDTKNQLTQCEINFEGYKHGNMYKLTKFVRGQGMVTIYGAENAIDFLWNHYCP